MKKEHPTILVCSPLWALVVLDCIFMESFLNIIGGLVAGLIYAYFILWTSCWIARKTRFTSFWSTGAGVAAFCLIAGIAYGMTVGNSAKYDLGCSVQCIGSE